MTGGRLHLASFGPVEDVQVWLVRPGHAATPGRGPPRFPAHSIDLHVQHHHRGDGIGRFYRPANHYVFARLAKCQRRLPGIGQQVGSAYVYALDTNLAALRSVKDMQIDGVRLRDAALGRRIDVEQVFPILLSVHPRRQGCPRCSDRDA